MLAVVLRRAAAVAVLLAASMGGLMAAAGEASAAVPTINCDTAAQPSANWTTCQKLVGTAKCVWNNKDGTYTLAVGYINPTTSNLYASVPNANNAFTATAGFAANPAHTDTFFPGTYTTAWTVTWTPSSKTDLVSWALMGKTYTWADTYTVCPSKPVPVIGNSLAAGLTVVAITGFGLLNRRRVRGWVAAARSAGTGWSEAH